VLLGLMQGRVGPQCVSVPRKIGELELDFGNPTWKSNWDFDEFTAKFY